MLTDTGLALAAYVQLDTTSSFGQPSQAAASQTGDGITEELMQWCEERLPAAAVPTSIVLLRQLPLSAGAKLMRGALSPPWWAAQQVKSEQQTPTEEPNASLLTQLGGAGHEGLFAVSGGLEGRILRLFQETLALPRLEPADNFFQAGGDSLAAAAVANAIGVHPDLVVALPTARRLAAALRQSSSSCFHEPHKETASNALHSKQTSSRSAPEQHEIKPSQVPTLTFEPGLTSTVADTGEDEAWQQQQQQAQQALAACTQQGGWVFERAGGRRWAGKCRPFNLAPDIGNSSQPGVSVTADHHGVRHQQHVLAHQATEWPSTEHACLPSDMPSPLNQGAQLPQQQQQQQQQSSLARSVSCCWRVKLKECIDASPLVLVTAGTSHPSGKQAQPPQPKANQHQQQQQQQQQQPQDRVVCVEQQQRQCAAAHAEEQQQQEWQQVQQQQEWVFACSHGGDVVCVEGQQGRAIWRVLLPARAEAGLAITPDCQVNQKMAPAI